MDEVQEVPNEIPETLEIMCGHPAHVVWLGGRVDAFPTCEDQRVILAAFEKVMDARGPGDIAMHREVVSGHRVMLHCMDCDDFVMVIVELAPPHDIWVAQS